MNSDFCFSEIRSKLNLSQEELAELSGLSYGTLLHIEHGDPVSEKSYHTLVCFYLKFELLPIKDVIPLYQDGLMHDYSALMVRVGPYTDEEIVYQVIYSYREQMKIEYPEEVKRVMGRYDEMKNKAGWYRPRAK